MSEIKRGNYPASIIPTPEGGRIVKTNCFECHSKCGVLVYVDQNERVYKVTGNPEDPRNKGTVCSKAQTAKKILYHPERINYPLKRIGEKGGGRWERISWDEAMNTIASRLLAYKEQFGPESVVFAQGTGRGTNQWCQRLGKSLGMNHWCCPAHVCLLPAMMTCMITYGFFPVWDGADFANSKCIVLWGANPNWTEGSFTNVPMVEGREKGAKLIVVDPHFEHPMAHKADYWLPIRPGADGAMAMSWMNVIIKENLYDRPFVERWTNATHLIDVEGMAPIVESMIREGGSEREFVIWDKKSGGPKGAKSEAVEPELEGTFEILLTDGKRKTAKTVWTLLLERIENYPPEKAAELTWVDAETIRNAARLYASCSPGACINFMQGLEEHVNCTSAMRGICCLMAITGNLDVRGGNVWLPFWNEMLGPRLTGPDPPQQREKKLGDLRLYPVSQPTAVWKAIITEKPYPIKAYVSIQGNPLSWSENPAYVEKALRKIEFLVVMDYFLSPTAQLADIVLPSAHWTERDYIAEELCGRYFFAQQRAINPLYERKSDITFMRELGRLIAPDWWPWRTDEEMFDFQLEPYNITWKELQDRWVLLTAPEIYRKYEDHGFETPSGLVELYSNVLKSVGGDPLPTFEPPPPTSSKYPFILITGRRYPNYYHSAYRGISWLRELAPHPMVDINPKTALELGIRDGDLVWIESSYGKVQMFARLTNGVHPRVLSAPHGWWQACEELNLPGYPNHISNINMLMDNVEYNPEFGTPNLRARPVTIYKALHSEIPGFPYLNLREAQS
jgi:anaerobic selenocysteine-containing dehydrogenase